MGKGRSRWELVCLGTERLAGGRLAGAKPRAEPGRGAPGGEAGQSWGLCPGDGSGDQRPCPRLSALSQRCRCSRAGMQCVRPKRSCRPARSVLCVSVGLGPAWVGHSALQRQRELRLEGRAERGPLLPSREPAAPAARPRVRWPQRTVLSHDLGALAKGPRSPLAQS